MSQLHTPDVPTPFPLDHPDPTRSHRVYIALTNGCNRACPWCSTCSSPAGSTYFPLHLLQTVLPETGPFELQLEGGEPTIHPDFMAVVARARAYSRCSRVVICTNGVRIPRQMEKRQQWLRMLGSPLTLKLSINHHLLDQDPGLIRLAQQLVPEMMSIPESQLVLNVRLRKGYAHDDQAVLDQVTQAGLLAHTNVFYLQRYGFAADESGWETPFLVGHNFRLVNPDGQIFGPDLIARSEAMRRLP